MRESWQYELEQDDRDRKDAEREERKQVAKTQLKKSHLAAQMRVEQEMIIKYPKWSEIPVAAKECLSATASAVKISGPPVNLNTILKVKDGDEEYVLKIEGVRTDAERDRFYLMALQESQLAYLQEPTAPSVVPILDAFRCSGLGQTTGPLSVLKMPPYDGNVFDLFELFEFQALAMWVDELFSIVDFLDAVGIVHGDLKLDQFLYRTVGPKSDRQMQILLTDFGFAGHWGDPMGLLHNFQPSVPDASARAWAGPPAHSSAQTHI